MIFTLFSWIIIPSLLDHFHQNIRQYLLPLNSFSKKKYKQTNKNNNNKKPLTYIFQYSPPHSFTTKPLLMKISFPVSQRGWAAEFSPWTSLPHLFYFLGDSHLIHAENAHILIWRLGLLPPYLLIDLFICIPKYTCEYFMGNMLIEDLIFFPQICSFSNTP